MISTRDIRNEIEKRLDNDEYFQSNIENKKKMLDFALKGYLKTKTTNPEILKLAEDSSDKELSVTDLLKVLSKGIPEESYLEVFKNFSFCVKEIVEQLQGRLIEWWCEDDETLINKPIIEFDEHSRWNKIISHKKTDPIIMFDFIYSVFNDSFMTENEPKKRIMRLID